MKGQHFLEYGIPGDMEGTVLNAERDYKRNEASLYSQGAH